MSLGFGVGRHCCVGGSQGLFTPPAPLPGRTSLISCATHPYPNRQLGDVYGIPKVHYKGQQDDFYIMVGCGCVTRGFP